MSSSSHAATDGTTTTKQQRRIAQIRKEGGIFAFNTKFGALNPFAIILWNNIHPTWPCLGHGNYGM
jgi:hypothetical protein